ncbi:hypothetical protein ZIOFF_044853 [Zingiber officinale]|uniref:Uncharacterized protein n=1 Tax=Zingiber officinale TaxID=94328 RepID=A0A8J5FW09_ZINOF|nr:hypothetical protein ZIOFF_044853 [Zingiber officinale]
MYSYGIGVTLEVVFRQGESRWLHFGEGWLFQAPALLSADQEHILTELLEVHFKSILPSGRHPAVASGHPLWLFTSIDQYDGSFLDEKQMD